MTTNRSKEVHDYIAAGRSIREAAEHFEVTANRIRQLMFHYDTVGKYDLYQALVDRVGSRQAGEIHGHLRRNGIRTIEDLIAEIGSREDLQHIPGIGKRTAEILCDVLKDWDPDNCYMNSVRENEDAFDAAVAKESYDEYERNGKKSRPIVDLWRECEIE